MNKTLTLITISLSILLVACSNKLKKDYLEFKDSKSAVKDSLIICSELMKKAKGSNRGFTFFTNDKHIYVRSRQVASVEAFNHVDDSGDEHRLLTLEKVKSKFTKEYSCSDKTVLERFYITQKEAILSKEVFDVDTILFRGRMHLLLLSKTIPKNYQLISGLTVSLVNADVVDIQTGELVYNNSFTQAGNYGGTPSYSKIKGKYRFLISIDHGSTRMGYTTGNTEVYGFVGINSELNLVLSIEDSFYDNEGAVGHNSHDRKYHSTVIELSSKERNTLIVHKKGNNIDEITTYKYNGLKQWYEEVK